MRGQVLHWRIGGGIPFLYVVEVSIYFRAYEDFDGCFKIDASRSDGFIECDAGLVLKIDWVRQRYLGTSYFVDVPADIISFVLLAQESREESYDLSLHSRWFSTSEPLLEPMLAKLEHNIGLRINDLLAPY